MYHALIENKGDAAYHATTRHGKLMIGTNGQNSNPVDTMLAGLGACMGHYVRDWLDERHFKVGFTVEAKGTASADDRLLAKINTELVISGLSLSKEQQAELLLAVQRCKIHNTLAKGCDIQVSISIKP